ncbi:MAG TPA: DegV family protein [Gaiellaceae bacterium]|nr:DegV family protein [Gaiellaceae bacterium]HWJ44524.1 DegV family protein [Gaiellaceae bacterium]
MKLTAQNTAIVLDSTADFPEAPQRFPNWRVVPLYVLFGGESYRDYVDLAPPEFYARLRTADELPTTSQPTPGDFLKAYEGLAEYERIYSLHISAALSGTYQSATTAAAELGEKVRTIDSQSASAALAMLGLAIQRRLERGTSDEEVEGLVRRYREQAGLIFTVDTLEFLRRGGRIGRASAWAGQLLHVKPILTIEREVVPLKRVRGNQKAMQEFVTAFTSTTNDTTTLKVGIAHADAPERARQLEKMVHYERPHAEIEIVTTLGAVVGTHAGPGTVGFFWFDDVE